MKLKLLGALFSLGLMSVQAQEITRPKLIVGIVVDQMRYDYLTRFYNDYGNDGFKKIMREGVNCKNVHYTYKPTYTGPGHATIFTGTSPSVHGIVGNNWFQRAENKGVYCVELEEDGEKRYNPSRLLVETFGDAMKQFSNFKSKNFGISLKDRGAILPAGHLADGAYWFSSEEGIWVSDDYYVKKNPSWLKEFNAQDKSNLYLKDGWKLSKNIFEYEESIPDLNNYEYSLTKKSNTVFPYNLVKAQKETDWGILKKVPQGNQMSADLFKVLLKNESIGKDEFTDFVSLSFSATDYVGHRFGVQSVEVHDTYIKLDQTIANLLVFLDEQVGKGQYTVFLTSDHGAGMPRAYLQDKGIPNGQLNERTMKKELEKLIAAEGFNDNWISKLMNFNVYFSDSLKTLKNDEYLKIKAICANWLTKKEGVARVLDPEVTLNSQDEREQLAIRGYHPKRSGDLILIEEANWSSYDDKGSTHGSPYEYDTHVPLLFYGFGIPNAETVQPYPVTSIVSSLSILFGFQMSQGLLAKPIEEIFEQ